MEEKDKLRSFYDNVSSYLDIGSYDDFYGAMQDPSRRQKFFDSTSQYVDIGDSDKFNQFVGDYFGQQQPAPRVDVSDVEAQQQPQVTAMESPANGTEQAALPTQQTGQSVGMPYGDLTNENFLAAKQRREELLKKKDELESRASGDARALGFASLFVKDKDRKKEYDDVVSELDNINGFINEWNKTDEARVYYEQQKRAVDDVSARIDQMQIDRNRERRQKQVEEYEKKSFWLKLAEGFAAAENPITPEVVDAITDPTNNDLRTARNEVRNAKNQLRLEEMRMNGEKQGLGIVRGLETANYYELMPAVGMADAMSLLQLSQDIKNGKELTDSQKLLKEAMEARAGVDFAYQDNNTLWERIGQSTPEQLMFTLQFVVGAGVTGATKVGEKVAAKSAEKAAKRLAKKEATSAARNFVSTRVVPELEGMAVSSAIQTFANPLSVAGMVEDFEKRYAGDIYYDKDGNLHVFDNDRNAGQAAYQAIASAWIENFTEYAGGNITKSAKLLDSKMFDLAGKFDNVMKTVGAGKIQDVFKIPQQLGRLTQIGSAPEEFLEEELGSVMNALMATDAQRGESYGDAFKNTISSSFAGEQQLETFLSCAITSMLLGGGGNAVNGVRNAGLRKSVNQDVEQSKALLGKVRGIDIEGLDNMIENGRVSDISAYLKEQSDANNWNKDEQGAAVSYVLNRSRQIGVKHNDDTAIEAEQAEYRRQAEDMVNRWDGQNIYNVTYTDRNGETQEGTIVNGRVHYNTNEDGTYTFDPYMSSGMLAIRRADGSVEQVAGRNVTALNNVATIEEQLESQNQTIDQLMRAEFDQDGMLPTIESVWGGNLVPNVTQFQDGRYTYLGQDDNGLYAFANNDKKTSKDNPIVYLTERQLVEYGLSLNLENAQANGDTEAAQKAQDDIDFLKRLDEITADAGAKGQWDVLKAYAQRKVLFDANGDIIPDGSNEQATAAYLLAISEGSFENAIASVDQTIAALGTPQQTEVTDNAADNAAMNNAAATVDADKARQIDFYTNVRNRLTEMQQGKEEADQEEAEQVVANTPVSHMEVGQQFPVDWNGTPAVAVVEGRDADGRNLVTVYDANDRDGLPLQAGIEVSEKNNAEWEARRVRPQEATAPEQATNNPKTLDDITDEDIPKREDGTVIYYEINDPMVYAKAALMEEGNVESALRMIDEDISGLQRDVKDSRFRERAEARLKLMEEVKRILLSLQQQNTDNVSVQPEPQPTPTPVQPEPAPQQEQQLPRDKEGNIDYEQITDPALYAQGLVDEFGEEAIDTINDLINEETEVLAKAGEKKNAIERRRAQKESQGKLDFYNKVKDIIAPQEQTETPTEETTPVEEAPTEQPAAETPVEEAPAETPMESAGEGTEQTEEPEQAPEQPTESVPDWTEDTAKAARERGYRMVEGERVDRQEPIDGVEGNEVEVKFSDTEKPKGKWKVVEAESLQPSHLNKRRNPRFFITEAQPKERKDNASDEASTKIAKDINPEEVMQGVTAYSGSPVINSRGEVIQGNNRTIGLQKMYESYPESQEKYKQALMDKAEQMGIDKDAIGKMQHPVLVRSVDVDDDTAIKLGQKTSQDTESGGKQRMGASQVRNSLGDKYANLIEMLFADTTEDEGIGEAIARNGVNALKYLWNQKAINNTQYQSALENGDLTAEAKEDFRNIIMESLFEGGPDGLRTAFNMLPAKSQNAILQTIYRDAKSNDESKIKGEVQQAIMAFANLMGFKSFAAAKNQTDVENAVNSWLGQQNMFSDVANTEKYSNFALELAKRFKWQTLTGQRAFFNELYDKLQGVASEGLSMFEEVQQLGLAEAIKAVYGIDYLKPQQNNGISGSNVVADDNGTRQEGEQGGTGETESGERAESGERSADDRGGDERADREGQEDKGREITLDEIRNAWENGFDGVDEETLDAYYQWLLKNANDEESNRILDDMNDLLGIEDEAEEEEEQEEETPNNEEPKPKQEKKTKEQLEQERREDILSLKDPLTEEEIRNSSEDEIIKENALSYLNGDRGVMAANCYLIIYDNVRNVTTGAERSGGTTDQSQLDAENNGNQEPGESGQSGSGTGRLGGEPSDTGRQTNGQKDNNGGVADTNGEGSLQEVEGDKPQKPNNTSANPTGRSGGRGNRGASVDGNGGREVGREDSNANADDGGENARDSLQDALDEFGDLLNDLTKENQAIRRRNQGILYANPIGANMSMEKLKIWAKLTVAGAKVGYELIKKGITKFADWSKQMNTLLSAKLTNAFGWDKDGVDQYILELWNSKLPIDGETHTVAEWASIMGKKKIREAISESREVKAEKQAKAENIEAKPADIDNINATLPFLLPEQRDDVLKAETQFFTEAHQDREHGYGKGYLFTNGTGTGKTYTGLGIIKRFVKMGKGRVLLVVPSEKKEGDWINSGKNLMLDIHSLRDDKYWDDGKSSTQRSGKGIVVTTDAAFRENFELLKDNFDLVVYDESHRIMSSNDANSTRYLDHHFMLTLKDAEAATQRAIAVSPEMEEHRANAKELDTIRKALAKNERLKNKIESGNGTQSDLDKLLSEQEENDLMHKAQQLDFRNASIIADIEARKSEFEQKGKAFMDAKQPKVVFLSATPFNTVDSMKYAEGYIFSYPEGDKNGELFKTQYFPSSFQSRHGKVQQSVVDAVQAEREEINFSERLQHELETMSGRIIENGYDYSRHFPTLTNEYATMFNEAVQRITSFAGYQPLYKAMYDTFLKGAGFAPALLETLKVALVIPRIKQHIAMGRKVVVFHRRRNSQEPPSPPFERMLNKAMMEATTPQERAAVKSAVDQFRKEFSQLLAYEQTLNYDMILKQFSDEFGNQVAFFNGDVKETEQENSEDEKKNISSIDAFNQHNGKTKIIVVQEASGKEGIDLHDTFGDEMRVEINLSLPQNPLTMLQIMGRIFRIGQKSNAVFEYPLIGLDFELMTFGSNMNQAVGTAENLALGDLSRGLRQALANGVLEHSGEVPLEGQGVGGVEYDRRSQEEGSYEKAMSDYYKAKAQKFPDTNATPEALGYKMVEWAGLGESDEVLEPSAGHGAIARYVPQENSLTAIEPNISLMAGLQLRASGRTRDFKNQTFEALDIINKYNVVLMNSQHQGQSKGSADIVKAYQHLREGGRMVVVSNDEAVAMAKSKMPNAVLVGKVKLPSFTFGDNVADENGKVVNDYSKANVYIFDIASRNETREEAKKKYKEVDLSDAKNIGELFANLKDVKMPERTIDDAAIDTLNAGKTWPRFKKLTRVFWEEQSMFSDTAMRVLARTVGKKAYRYTKKLDIEYKALRNNPRQAIRLYQDFKNSFNEYENAAREYAEQAERGEKVNKQRAEWTGEMADFCELSMRTILNVMRVNSEEQLIRLAEEHEANKARLLREAVQNIVKNASQTASSMLNNAAKDSGIRPYIQDYLEANDDYSKRSMRNSLTYQLRKLIYGELNRNYLEPKGYIWGDVDWKSKDEIESLVQQEVDDYINRIDNGFDPLNVKENISDFEKEKEYDIEDIRQYFYNLIGDNKDLRTLFDKVVKVSSMFGYKFKFTDMLDKQPSVMGDTNFTGLIRLKDSLFRQGADKTKQANVILHEMIHSSLIYATLIRTYDKAKYPTLGLFMDNLAQRMSPEMNEAVDELLSLFNTLKIDKRFTRRDGGLEDYGAFTPDEMIAELANPMFRAKLKAKRVWKKVVNAIAKFFGAQTKEAEESDALVELEKILDKFLNNADKSLYNDVKNMLQLGGYANESLNSEDTLYRSSDELFEQYPTWLSGQTTDTGQHTTQITSTVKTYEHIGDWMKEQGMDGAKVLDASSGLGTGTFALRDMGFNVDDVEPYPSEKREAPTYTRYEDVDGEYDVVISNAVLNVIPDDWRADVLKSMADKVKVGGKLIINVRDAKSIESQKQKIELDSPSEILVTDSKGNIRAYQKGFTKQELKQYVEDELGEGWQVEIANEKNSGLKSGTAVVVTRTSEAKPLQYREIEREYEFGEMLPITKDTDGRYRVEGLNDSYPNLDRLLDAWRDEHLDYFAEIRNGKLYVEPWNLPEPKTAKEKRYLQKASERAWRNMHTRANDTINKLGLQDRVTILDSTDGLEGKKKTAKGWFDPTTGKIVIVMPNHRDPHDVMKTILHEGVAHYGLRQLVGNENMNEFLDKVFEHASKDVRDRIIDLAMNKYNRNVRKATEEYLAGLAEDTNFEDATEKDWFKKIKAWFMQMLHKVGVDFGNFGEAVDNATLWGDRFTDNELRYLLWKSYRNLVADAESRTELARDVMMQSQLGVGNYAPQTVAAESMARENSPAYMSNEELFVNLLTDKKEIDNGILEEIIRRVENDMARVSRLPENESGRKDETPSIAAKAIARGIRANGNGEVWERGQARKAIKQWAKDNGYWYDEIRLHEGTKEREGGAESRVFVADDYSFVRKLTQPVFYNDSQPVLESLEMFGNVFGDTAYTIKGFGENEFGQLCIVAEQPFIAGETLKDTGRGMDWIYNTLGDYMESMGFERVGRTSFKNDKYTVYDINANNVIIDGNGDLFVIDAGVKLTNNDDYDNDDILFRDAEPANKIADEYNRETGANVSGVNAVKRGWEKFARDQFDGYRPLEQMQKLIEKALGRKLRDSEKAYELATQLTSKTGQQIEREQLSYMVPVLQQVTDVIKALKDADGYSRDEAYDKVTNYMLAKHGLERNEWFEKQGKDEGDYSGLRGLAERLGYNPDDYKTAAEATVKDMEDTMKAAGIDVNEFWKTVNALTNRMLEISYESGMIDKDTFEDLKKRHKYYVPLRGFAEGTAADLFDYVTQSPHFQNIFQKAKGRQSMADDPLANLMSMLHSAIVIGNQNQVMQKIYNLAVNSNSDLLRVTKPWYVYNDALKTWEEKYPDIPEDATADEIDAIVKQFDADMAQLKANGKAKRKYNRIDVGKKLLRYQAKEHEMVAYIDGQRVLMHVAGNPLVAQAMNRANTQRLNKVMQGIQTITRWYSAINTSWSPAFGPKNAERDIRMMLFGAYTTGGIKKMWQSARDMVKAGWALPRLLITGKMDGGLVKALGKQKAAQLEQWWNEFLDNGGETGFTRTLNAEKAKGEVKDMIRHMLNGSKDGENRVRKYTIGLIEWIGRYSEDISRFAAYCQQRAQGESVLSSIQEAKNVTVNFNVKGGSDLAANMRALYSFFNASMQGINRMRRLATEHPGRFSAGIAAMMLGGAVLPWLNMAMFAMLGGDDDDWRKYEELTEYTANHNMILYVGNHKFISIPWSQELAPFNALGNIWFRQQMGWNKGRSVAEQWGDMFVDLSPVSVASGNKPGVGLVKTVMPSFTTPIWESLFNEDFTGSPLYKDNQWNKYDAAWEKAYVGKTSQSVIDASRWLNEKTDIDINPAIAEHLFSGVLGGVGRSGDKLLRYFTNGFQLQDAPFIRTMMFDSKKQGYIGAVQREYGRNAYDVLPKVKHDVDDMDAMEFAQFSQTEEFEIANLVSVYKTGKDLAGNKKGIVGIDAMEKEYKKIAGSSDGSEEYREQLEEIRSAITERKMEMLDEIQQIKYEHSGDLRKRIIEYVNEVEQESKEKKE